MSKPVKYHIGKFPPSKLDWPRLIPYLGAAAAAVARYDGILTAVPNPELLLSPMTTQEAVLSSKIEGTQASMSEVLEYEADSADDRIPSSRREDIQEILNYRRAMGLAQGLLSKLPLSSRVVRDVHKQLMQGVRGADKAPGEFRRIPNWIGPPGCTIEEARFVPIDAGELPNAMSKWEVYVNDDQPDKLVQLAILHAEFEALHPFLDGNGRVGRMMVPLFMWQHGLIHRPMFYMSAYLEAFRDVYYEKLLAVSRDGDWTGWCEFFIAGVQEQAEANLTKAKEILDLYEELKPVATQATHSQYAIHALDWIFSRPVFQSPVFISSAEIPASTARRILQEFKRAGILVEVRKASGRRPALLAFWRLINTVEGKEIVSPPAR